MPNPLWTQQLNRAGLVPPPDAFAKLDAYLDLLIAWNEKLNLTRITERADAEVKHIADALTLLPFLPALAAPTGEGATRRRVKLADVGTGGGVPGVPLAICRPDLDVTLIDSTKKKLDAVAQMTSDLALTNVTTLHARVESLRSPYDVVVARAVAELGTLLGWCRGIVAPGGKILAMKGPRASQEIEALDARTRRAWKLVLHDVSEGLSAGRFVIEITRA